MRAQLAQQAQELLGQNDLVIITERVADVALLIGQMVKMGFVEVLDRHLPRHWKQRRVSWGWTAVKKRASETRRCSKVFSASEGVSMPGSAVWPTKRLLIVLLSGPSPSPVRRNTR